MSTRAIIALGAVAAVLEVFAIVGIVSDGQLDFLLPLPLPLLALVLALPNALFCGCLLAVYDRGWLDD